MTILCKLGIHNWKYTGKNTYWDRRTALQKERLRRTCTKCSRIQEQEVHCLGLNPPKYLKTWLNIRR